MDAELRREHAEMKKIEMMYKQGVGAQGQGERMGQLPGYEDVVRSGQGSVTQMSELRGNGEAK